MSEAYSATRGDFADRILAALDAAQEAGGDIRGKQSACILIVAAKPSDKPWADRLMDLRVEDHPEPLKELRRLVTVQRAYEAMDQGDYFISLGEVEKARAAYSRGAALAPDIAELPFWVAVTLADIGKLDEALPIFREVFRRDPNLAELLQRLPPVNLLHITSEQMKLILQQRA
jgi:uncharacterized Ntn-hydrolase superfamily protein